MRIIFNQKDHAYDRQKSFYRFSPQQLESNFRTFLVGGKTEPELPVKFEYNYVRDRKSTRLNSSHDQTSYAVFCLKKKIHCDRINHMNRLIASVLTIPRSK